jgi:hypothetical protein
MNSAEIWLLIKYTAVFLFFYLVSLGSTRNTPKSMLILYNNICMILMAFVYAQISGTVVSWIWPQKNQKKYKSLPGPYFVVWLLNYLKNKFFGDANKVRQMIVTWKF